MTPNPKIVQSIEKLDYRVTVGDVAAQAGLELNFAQQGLLALASEAGGHLQVAESGDVVYLFPKNFQGILRNKYWRLRWQKTWSKIWRVLFYIIRISFGIILIASILLMAVAIIAIIVAANSSNDDREGGSNRSYGGGFGGGFFVPHFWFGDIFWLFDPGYNRRRRQRRRQTSNYQMNFLESVFSFLFGDGNPNADLEEHRWQTIGSVIRSQRGAVAGEQIAPYVDKMDQDEDYMLPVLSRFNGYPEVSPQGEIIYYFPELQVTAKDRQSEQISAAGYLEEKPWRFSQANSGQITMAAGLGVLNIVLALVLGNLLQDGTIAAELGGIVAFVQSILVLLFGYGVLYLLVPLVRYFWIQGRNPKIIERNQSRQQRAIALNQPDQSLRQKLAYASQFAQQKVISDRDLAYTTEDDLLDQNIRNADKIDRDWQKELESGS
ncbi:hypothetical protein [Pleurocapsa sp. FMAR1]|uniref:hypothetical protein n=1 Tax=Pleurocapsa sp. FMAR1 TaxID=3040204 RepID=UPI0029C7FD2F|nr:hypothetical protein [Pleurocapsa sp. FMAR1]